MTGNNDMEFSITEEDVTSHASTVYNCMKEYYQRLVSMGDVLGNREFSKKVIDSNILAYGILPGPGVNYEESFLLNDSFRVATIFHLCMSNATKSNLSWEGFLFARNTFEQALMQDEQHENLSVDSLTLRMFGVDPNILPRKYMAKNMKIDEFNQAVNLIIKEAKKLKSISEEEFDDYDDYFEYMEKEAVRITKVCHESGFFGTHAYDTFACALISQRMDVQGFDLLYNVPGVASPIELLNGPTMERIKENRINIIKSMQEQTLARYFE